MNILYHHRTKGKGVEGVHIHGIVNAFKRMKHKVQIVCPESMGKNKKASYDNLLTKIMPEFLFELMEIFYNYVAQRKLLKIKVNKGWSFIYERYAFFMWAGVTVAKKMKIPFILEVNYTTYTQLVRKRSRILLPIARMIEKNVFMNADVIFVVSSFLKEHLIELGIAENKIHLTPNAVDEEIFDSAPDTADLKKELKLKNKKVIGYVGGFYHWHGLDLLLKAVKKIEEKVPDLCLLLVGDGPMKEQLKGIAKELSLATSLVFPEIVEYKKLPHYVNVMDICVLPDSNNYGSPVKIFEYMAMGKPVISPHLGPLCDVIKDGENGILFNPRDIGALAASIKKLLTNVELYNYISFRAKLDIFNNHLWKHNAAKIIQAYHSCENNVK